jgi:chromosome partitioning protein
MIVTVGNTKGGTGKSTIAVNLAIARGGKVLLIDSDRQGTSETAMLVRAQSCRLPFVPCEKICDGEALCKRVAASQQQFDDIVIDAGGRDSTALRAALGISDLVLIPFAPRSLDVWALSDMDALVAQARTANPDLRAFAMLSCADSTGHDNRDAVEALADYKQLIYMPTPISRRKSVANAVGLGLSVLELKPKDDKAIAEFKKLLNIVFMPL